MSARNRKARRDTAAEINIIPLLDVLLVLVAVLLLLTPFMAKSISVDLPTASSGAVASQDTSITIEVRYDGSFWHEGEQLASWSDLAPKLKGATKAKVFADKGAAFAAITEVLDNLAAHDVHNIQFQVKP